MPPIRKQQLDKAAWLWVKDEPDPSNISDNHIDAAYRGNIPRCKIGSCKRNCRGNPYCLSGLGEAKWLSEKVVETDEEDLELQCRAPGSFVGLKNLGATCYVNSLLQLLFHNPAFRRALFLWNPFEDPLELGVLCQDGEVEDECTKTSHSVVGQLQFLFGLMQFGRRRSIDPLDFIKSLDLEPSLQQDAQEFSKLLFSLLEDSLQPQSDVRVKSHIADYFRGEYSYITRCFKCQNDSVSPSMFYELDLNVKGHKTLHESISEFLKEEKLEGDNKYFCSFCKDKQEAIRFISLRKIPPVLNLQLMRFIYDRQKGSKKKITSSLQFPDTLDMSQYLTVPAEEQKPMMYHLTAVLIHKGPSANSGHYVAHICDQTTGTWYKFNDELVEKIEGKLLKLGSEDDELTDGSKKSKQPRLAKGYLESSNAYMLVYTSQSIQEMTKPITEEDLRPELLEKIKKANEDFDNLIMETKVEKKLKKENIQAYKSEISTLINIMPVISESDRDWEAVSLKWLTHWLSNATSEVKPIDNSTFLCRHNRLHPDLVASVKYISVPAADILYGKYGGGPRLPASEAICTECVSAKCRVLRFKADLIRDAKEISALLKQKKELNSGYWVGKKSLKNWRRKATLIFEEGEGNTDTDREPEDCPSPTSDNDVISTEPPPTDSSQVANRCLSWRKCSSPTFALPSLHSFLDSPLKKVKSSNSLTSDTNDHIPQVLDSLENMFQTAISETRSYSQVEISSLISNFYEKWQQMDAIVRKMCEFNTKSCVSPTSCVVSPETVTSKSTVETSYSEQPVVINGESNNGEAKSKKRKHEGCQEKDGDEEIKNGVKSDEEDYDSEDFNLDLICSHGNFTPDVNLKRLVSEDIWRKFKTYFPDCREFPFDAEVCPECLNVASQDQVSLDLQREQALAQKKLFPSLINGRNRPPLVSGTYRLICVPEFLHPWRKFVRENGRCQPLYSLRNSTLVCVHGLLLYSPALPEDASFFCPVTDEEWENLLKFYSVDTEILVTYGETETQVIETSPKLCEECHSARLASELEALLIYEKAKIYIRRISNSPEETPSLPESSTEVGGGSRKPQQTSGQGGVASAAGGASGAETSNATEAAAIRRSSRHRRAPGEKELVVSSMDTLRDLKIKVLEVLEVSPTDQHLFTEEGVELTDPAATLASLRIFPNSVLTLKVDEPMEIDFSPAPEPEAGFKGTVLLKR